MIQSRRCARRPSRDIESGVEQPIYRGGYSCQAFRCDARHGIGRTLDYNLYQAVYQISGLNMSSFASIMPLLNQRHRVLGRSVEDSLYKVDELCERASRTRRREEVGGK